MRKQHNRKGLIEKGSTARHAPTTRLLVEGMIAWKLPQLVLSGVVDQADGA